MITDSQVEQALTQMGGFDAYDIAIYLAARPSLHDMYAAAALGAMLAQGRWQTFQDVVIDTHALAAAMVAARPTL